MSVSTEQKLMKQYLDELCGEIESGLLEQYLTQCGLWTATTGPSFVPVKAVDHRFANNFLERILYYQDYMAGIINNVKELAFYQGKSPVDMESRGIEFCVLRLYYLKMIEQKKEPFPSDYTLFLFRFMCTLAFYRPVQALVQRMVPEHKWTFFLPYLITSTNLMMQSNFTDDNAHEYVNKYINSLALALEMEEYCPVKLPR